MFNVEIFVRAEFVDSPFVVETVASELWELWVFVATKVCFVDVVGACGC